MTQCQSMSECQSVMDEWCVHRPQHTAIFSSHTEQRLNDRAAECQSVAAEWACAQAESLAERHQTLAHQRNHSVALHLDERHVRANGLLLQQPGLMAKLQARCCITPSAVLHPVLCYTQ